MPPLMLMLAGILAGDPLTETTVRVDVEATMAPLEQAVAAADARCENGRILQAEDGSIVPQGRNGPVTIRRSTPSPLNDLMLRQGDPVSKTLLLERRIGQCSAPISTELTTPGGALPSFPARVD